MCADACKVNGSINIGTITFSSGVYRIVGSNILAAAAGNIGEGQEKGAITGTPKSAVFE